VIRNLLRHLGTLQSRLAVISPQCSGHSETEIVLVTLGFSAKHIAEGVSHIFSGSPSITLILGLRSVRLERCPVTDFRHTVDPLSAGSSQSTFGPPILTYIRRGCFTQVGTPARQARIHFFPVRRGDQCCIVIRAPVCSKILFMSFGINPGIGATVSNAKNRQAYQNLQFQVQAAAANSRQRSRGIWIRAERVLVKPLSDTSLLFETCVIMRGRRRFTIGKRVRADFPP
jgi:hypothetical protein